MNTLGIYFGPKEIDITESNGKRLVKHVQIPLSGVAGSDLEDKVPLEIKIVALFNEALRRNKIESKEAVLSLSGKDFIIRTFEMPNLPKEEMASAINFEAKKYIPFKVEELISNYQIEVDKSNHVNTVLFVGIKKETLDRYFFIFNQLNIKITQIEYCGFSIIRALKLSGVKDSGIAGVICAPYGQDDEVNFSVLENGFPLFSRDISLDLGPAEGPENSGNATPPSALLDKLKAEIRVSLDYYQRKFVGKNIQKMYVIVNHEQYQELDGFLHEFGFTSKLIDIAKVIGKPVEYSSGLVKGYSASTAKVSPIKVKINLTETKARLPKAAVVTSESQEDPLSLFRGVRIDYRVVLLGIIICLSALGYGIYQAIPFQKELKDVISKRVKVDNVDDSLSSDKLEGISSAYQSKLNNLDALIRKQLYLTETLDAIPRYIPEGVWLVNFTLNKREASRVDLVLDGRAYLRSSDKEFEAVNKFLEQLKQDSVFSKYFTNINILSINQQQEGKIAITSFSLSCKNYKEGR